MKKLFSLFSIIICAAALCISLFAAETVIYVSANGNDTGTGSAQAPLNSLYAAFRALPYGGKIVICDEIGLASTELPKTNGLVTITSHDGSTDYRTKNGAKLKVSGNIYLKSGVKFENLDFSFTSSSLNFVCNGNYTCFGEGLDISTASSDIAYPRITVGAIGLVGADGGYVEIHSGTFSRIYGGAAGANSAAHTGDTTVVIYGGTFTDVFYMTGVTKSEGNTRIYVFDGTFQSGLTGTAEDDISGNLYVSVYGGDFASYIRPATKGTLSGSCTINLLGGNLDTVYNVDGGAITGDLKINLAKGITLAHCPFSTSVISNADALKSTDLESISAAAKEKYPEYSENPLTARASAYKGISPKATSFVKEVAGGDMNNDGKITLVDALRAFKSAVGGTYSPLADIDEDKNVSLGDTMLILQKVLADGSPITEYNVENIISKNLIRYGNAVVTDNKMSSGYIFGTTAEKSYTLYSKAVLESGATVGLYFGCSSSSPLAANGYYFEADTAKEMLTVYRIENSCYRTVAEKKLHLLSNEAEIKVTYGVNEENAVQIYFNDNPLVTDSYFDFDLILPSKGTGVGLYVENAIATTPVVVKESVSASGSTYTNNVISSLTDPDIYYEDGTYYIYGTKSGGASGVQGYATADFVTFISLGTVLSIDNGFGDKNISAANIVKHGGTYYMFYLQESNSLGYSTTGYATSLVPQGPFTNDEKQPLTSETDLIGGQPFIDDDGKIYLIYTRTTGGNRTYISELSLSDGNAVLNLDTETLLLSPSEEWEYAKASVLECGFIIKHDGTYYLIYAGGNYNSTYGVGYATSDNIYGPYTKYSHNPIMWSNDQAFGNGAASVFVSPDASEHFIIYLRNNSPTVTRPLNTCIDRIRFVPNPSGGADLLEIAGATVSPQALPSGIGCDKVFDYQSARWHW